MSFFDDPTYMGFYKSRKGVTLVGMEPSEGGFNPDIFRKYIAKMLAARILSEPADKKYSGPANPK